jgi:CubicO group peptidase (beta-lactamase class C family)
MNRERPFSTLTVLCLALLFAAPAAAQTAYYPGRADDWERWSPERAGLDPARLEAAIEFAKAKYASQPRDGSGAPVFNPTRDEPYGDIVGPVRERGASNGLVLRQGRLVAEWGDTRRVDMTFSVTKTYLSTTAGLAWDRGMIRLEDPAREYVQDPAFESPHNARITWHQLLNQTSGWEGTLWGKPDWADRFNGTKRGPEEPGQTWRYNDTRVNALALALLHVWRRPLPQVLKEYVMDPIDASPTWRWNGYDNSWVVIDGLRMQSVSGGGHWGGGMFISSRDHARFGYLFLRGGVWKGRRIISEDWIRRASTPTPQNPTYGYMNWFLNTNRKQFPSAPESSIFFLGNGTNMIWLEREHDLVVVVRWLQDVDGFIRKVMEALKAEAASSR